MVKTSLFEIKNNYGDIIRGILQTPSDFEHIVVCVGGFERSTTTEKKFTDISERLLQKNLAVCRFDFSGLGLSTGDFSKSTRHTQAEELYLVATYIKDILGVQKISFVGHSFGCVVIATYVEKYGDNANKYILISPATNQKELLRYWFVSSEMKRLGNNEIVTWNNFYEKLNENEFLVDTHRTDKIAKINYIGPTYFIDGSTTNMCAVFKGVSSKVTIVQGEVDTTVPLESFKEIGCDPIMVSGGDHDIEKPPQRDFWIPKVVDIITNY